MNFTQKGEYFGYPPCCIKSFIEQYNTIKQTTPISYILNNNTGFLPCYKCSARILSGELKLTDLIKNRECETDFPNGGGTKILRDNNALLLRINKATVIK
jgi:hypothetical protein